MERLKMMKERLVNCIEGEMANLGEVDTKELGEAIDMVKDLAEAIYYCTVTEAMKKGEEEERKWYGDRQSMPNGNHQDNGRMYYRDSYYPPYGNGYPMYYTTPTSGSSSNSNGSSNGSAMSSSSGSTRNYTEREMPMSMMHDEKEGKSYMSRKTYMESKEMHQDKNVKLKELEKYMQELTSDMVEMIQGASPEEKQLLEKRISALATKIGQTNG